MKQVFTGIPDWFYMLVGQLVTMTVIELFAAAVLIALPHIYVYTYKRIKHLIVDIVIGVLILSYCFYKDKEPEND